jgi:hypothetical protein
MFIVGFLVGFLLALLSGLHKIRFCYSLFAIMSWHISAHLRQASPHFFNAPFVDIFALRRILSHITKAVLKISHYLIFVLIIALSNDINQHNLDCTLLVLTHIHFLSKWHAS